MINTADQLVNKILNQKQFAGIQNCCYWYSFPNFVSTLFCPSCGSSRSCDFSIISREDNFQVSENNPRFDFPVVYKSVCRECGQSALLVLYQGPAGTELAILHDTYGGCVTPHTPDEVKYYIDQAYRARCIGALSASAAMYRSALECFLYHCGYQDGMLAKKITQLQKDLDNGTVVPLLRTIDPEFLKAIKDIGNGAIHANDGNVQNQLQIDAEALQILDAVFAELLDKVYEQPFRAAERLSKLKSVAATFKKP